MTEDCSIIASALDHHCLLVFRSRHMTDITTGFWASSERSYSFCQL